MIVIITFFLSFGDGTEYVSNIYENTIPHLYTTTGNYNVSLTVSNEFCTSEKIEENYISVLMVDINENDENFLIYPNPANDNIFISDNNSLIKTITLFDINGKIIKIITSNKDLTQIDLNDINNGVYFIKIETTDFVILKKISVIK